MQSKTSPRFGARWLVASCLVLTVSLSAAQQPARKMFGKGHPFTLEELPAGKLKEQLQALDPQSRGKAMQWLHRLNFGEWDAAENLRADPQGGIYIVCPIGCADGCNQNHKHSVEPSSGSAPLDGSKEEAQASGSGVAVDPGTENGLPVEDNTGSWTPTGTVLVANPPVFSSKPGATKVIYIDVNGATVTGTSWNSSRGVTRWDCRPWSQDADDTTFSTSEQLNLKRIWERIAEDYAPFDVNVTTDTQYDPDVTGGSNNIGWILITPTTDANGVACPHNGSGGIAYVGVYGNSNYASNYQPAWTTPMGTANTAEAASHEMGHNMGLNHDGYPDPDPGNPNDGNGAYYGGHGSGDTSWGPIMGTGYGRSVSQWSKGEYFGASNTQDDLAIIAARVGYRTDDHGNTNAAATAITPAGNGTFSNTGIIERTSEVDVFSFSTGAGAVTLNANPYRCDTETRGGNLDILLELYDSGGTLVTSNNGSTVTNATISTTLAAGNYFLHVKPTGVGDPFNATRTGYTVYGSVGEYKLTGTIILPGVGVTESGGSTVLAESGGSDSYTLVLGTQPSSNVTVTISPNSQLTADKSSVVFTGGPTGNWNVPQTVTLTAVDDSLDEGAHQGIVSHSCTSADAAFNGISVASVIANIADNDNVQVVSPNGGETLFTGYNNTITWYSLLGGNVEIKLLKNGSDYLTIASSTPNDGSHIWNAPQSVAVGSDYTVRVTHITTSRSDVSDATFSIAEGPIYYASMDTNPGWTLGTGWAYGQPTGQGQDAYGSPDPTSGQNGPNVIGYNLNGDYDSGLTSTRWATTPAIDCSSYSNVRLEFQRWLGVEGGYDNAYIEVSNNGTNWTLVWENSNTNGQNTDDGAWVPVSYDISAVADGQATVYVRWGMGTTDGSWNWCGWNLDEVRLTGDRTAPTPGVTLTTTGGSTDVTEGGATDSYTIVLDTQPSTSVTVNIAGDADVSVSPTFVTFTGGAAGNWNVPQSVTVTAVNDTDHELAHTGVITHTATSGDGAYSGIFIPNLSVNVTDNDNTAPTVFAGVDKTLVLSENQPWTPAEIATQLWLDASDSATITLNGNLVSQWNDKSGNNRNASQATASAQPTLTNAALNGMNVVTFDGASDVMQVDLDFLAGTSHSVFIVTKTTAYGNIYGAANSGSGSNSLHVGFRDAASYRMNFWGNDWYGTIAAPFVAGQANLLNYVWTPGISKQIFANAVSQGTTTNAGAIGTMAGGGRIGRTTGHPFYGGDIAEIIMITGALSNEDKERLEGYLAHKWGMADKLPGGHTYKTDPPGGAGLFGSVTLSDATASDPENDPFTTNWSVVSGPAAVSFDDVSLLNATATFTQEGTYELRLSGTDGTDENADTVFINVDPPTTERIVTYNGNGNTAGTVPVDPNSPYQNNNTVTVLGNTGSLSKIGYSFAGWNTAPDGSGANYAPGNSFTITSNVTLFAQWTPNGYTVNFDKQGGTGGSNSVAATFGAAMPSATPPTKSGFAFAGYYTGTNGSGTRYYDASMNSVRAWDIPSNTTLYARWTNAYTVTFQTDGTPGATLTGNISQTLAEGADCTPVTANAPGGYYFVNWTNGGTPYSTDNPLTVVNVTAGMTLTANFAPIPSIAISNSGLIAEGAENGKTITVTLIDGVFSGSVDGANWTVGGLPAGVSKGAVTRLSDTSVSITLSGNRTADYDSNITGVSVSCTSAEIVNYGSGLTATTGVTLTAVNDAEFIEIADDGWIQESFENGESITVIIHGGTFSSSLSGANWTVSNLPAGVTKGAVTRINDQVATISLFGNRTGTYGGTDITNVSVSCTTAEYDDSTGGGTLSATSGVTLRALNGGTVELQQGLDSYTGAADTFIYKADAAANFSSQTTIDLNNQKNQTRYGLLKFDLSGIPAGSDITAATLEFTAGGGGLESVDVYNTIAAWNASTATWNSSNGVIGTTLYGSTTITNGAVGTALPAITLDPTLIEGWLANPASNTGFGIQTKFSAGNSNSVLNVCSSEHATQANRPKLTITYVSSASGAPEMTVQGQGLTINSGDTTPNAADDTDFGAVATGGSSLVHTFTIKNEGSTTLNLSGAPVVEVTGTHAADFSVSVLPSTTVAAGGSTTFQISFSPSGAGARSATISIANDDQNEGTYTFAVMGEGVGATPPYDAWSGGPAFNVDSNGDGIANGLAWALGASSTSANAIGLMPVIDADTDPNYLIFNFRRLDAAKADTAIVVEHGTTLGAGDWQPIAINGVDSGNPGDNVVIREYDNGYVDAPGGSGVDRVEVKLKKSAFGSGGKMFARLKVTYTR